MLAERIGDLLVARDWCMTVAESATGGLVGHVVTQVSGSSRYFLGGVIAYANEVKQDLLGVREETLIAWGAVSPQVALEMAQGVRQLMNTEVGLSITGIAGPTGATATKPVGLYYIGLAFPNECWTWRYVLKWDRQTNNSAIANAALAHLVDYLT
jgi:PncC family amidohydrolase